MFNVTKPQIQKIHMMFKSLGIMKVKETIVLNFTEQRTCSTKEMTFNEAKALLTFLCDFDPKEKQIKAIRLLAFRCGIIYGDTPDDSKINNAKLNLFLKSNGTVKKDLYQQSLEELIHTHKQLSAIEKSMKIFKERKQVYTELEGMLSDLNIPNSNQKTNK